MGDRLPMGKPAQHFSKPPGSTQPPTLNGTGNEYTSLIQAINNPDGSTSYVAIDTGDPDTAAELVTLADVTNARVLHAVGSAFPVGCRIGLLSEVCDTDLR